MDMDAQSVYSSLIDLYDNQLPICLDATNLRTEITMKLDDKWPRPMKLSSHNGLEKLMNLKILDI
jgi:hypothetical protein